MGTRPAENQLLVIAAFIAIGCGNGEPSCPCKALPETLPEQPAPAAEAAPIEFPVAADSMIALVGDAVAGKLTPLAEAALPAAAIARLGSLAFVHPGIEDLGFGPGAKFLITSGAGKIRLWDPGSGRLLAPPLPAELLAVAHDGSVAAAVWPEQPDAIAPGDGRILNLWEPAKATSLRHERLAAQPRGFEFVGDLLTIHYPRLILKRGQTSESRFDLPIAKTGDGQLVAGRDRRDRSWIVVQPRHGKSCRFFDNGASSSDYRIDISPDGQYVAYSDGPRSAGIYALPRRHPDGSYAEVRSGYRPRYAFLNREVHTYSRATAVPRFTAASDLLVVSSRDYPVVVFHVSEPLSQELPDTAPALAALALSPDRKLIATASTGGRVRLWADDQSDARGAFLRANHPYALANEPRKLPARLAELSPALSPPGHNSAITQILFSRDGKLIITGGNDKLTVWNATSLESERFVPIEAYLHRLALVGPASTISITSVSTGPRRRLVDVRSGEPVVLLEDLAPVDALPSVANDSKALAFANGIAAVASGYAPGPGYARLELWDIAANRKLWHRDLTVTAAAFASGRPLLAVGTAAGHLLLLDLANQGATLRDVAGHEAALTALAFEPDDSRLVSGSADTTALVWNVAQLLGGAPAAPKRSP